MAEKKRYQSKELTNHLRELAAEAHDMTEDGDLVTKGAALAQLLFKKALGYEEKQRDDEGKESLVYHKPEAWAISLIYERLEGKTPQAITEDEQRLKAADKVRELAKQRLNSLTATLVGSVKSGPPKFSRRKEV